MVFIVWGYIGQQIDCDQGSDLMNQESGKCNRKLHNENGNGFPAVYPMLGYTLLWELSVLNIIEWCPHFRGAL